VPGFRRPSALCCRVAVATFRAVIHVMPGGHELVSDHLATLERALGNHLFAVEFEQRAVAILPLRRKITVASSPSTMDSLPKPSACMKALAWSMRAMEIL
jgi:hypothetical protein